MPWCLALDCVLQWSPDLYPSQSSLPYKSHFHSVSSLQWQWLYALKTIWAQWRNRNITETHPWEHTAEQPCWMFVLSVASHCLQHCDHLAAAPATTKGCRSSQGHPEMEGEHPWRQKCWGKSEINRCRCCKKSRSLLRAGTLPYHSLSPFNVWI